MDTLHAWQMAQLASIHFISLNIIDEQKKNKMWKTQSSVIYELIVF